MGTGREGGGYLFECDLTKFALTCGFNVRFCTKKWHDEDCA